MEVRRRPTEKSMELLKHLHSSGADQDAIFVGDDDAVDGRGLSALERHGLIDLRDDGRVRLTDDGLARAEDLLRMIGGPGLS